MDEIVKALLDAGKSMLHPIILVIVLVPMMIALSIWVGIGWTYWDSWTSGIQNAVLAHMPTEWISFGAARIASLLAGAIVIAILTPVVILTAVLIATVFAMPVLVRHVAQNKYPNLELRHGGTLLGSVWNAVTAICMFALLWIATLPLWLLGPLAAPLPVLLSAYLNQRLFRYDALSEHASAQEMNQIFALAGRRLFLLGLMTGLLYFIPPLNFFAPVYAALAFIHLCLGELERLRSSEHHLPAESS